MDRSLILPVAANWKSNVRETIEYKTEIISNRDGWEQRRALRGQPRHSLEFEVLSTPVRAGTLAATLVARPGETMYVPHPTHRIRIDKPAPYQDDVVYIQGEKPAWAVPGAEVLISTSNGTVWIPAQITAGGLTYTIAFTEDLSPRPSPGDSIHRAVKTRMAQGQKFTSVIDSVLNGTARFDSERWPGLYLDDVYVAGSPWVIEGREVFPFRVDWSDAVQTTVDFYRESVDFGFGIAAYETPRRDSQRIYSFYIREFNRGRIDALVSFFMRQLGKCRCFWFESPISDVKPLSGLSAGSDVIKIAGRDFLRPYTEKRTGLYDPDDTFRKIVVHIQGHAPVIREVLGFRGVDEENESAPWINTEIVLDSVAGIDASITRIGWLTKARFGADSLALDWHTTECAAVTVAIQTVRD